MIVIYQVELNVGRSIFDRFVFFYFSRVESRTAQLFAILFIPMGMDGVSTTWAMDLCYNTPAAPKVPVVVTRFAIR